MTLFSNALKAGVAAAGILLGSGAAQGNENVMVVFDGSNSMWGQIDGTAKIEIARGVMKNLLGEWTKDRNVGLMAYGHRRRGDCTDIETLVEPGMAARDVILERINAITPTGKTPLTDAVEQAAKALSYTDKPATVVLISDGLESCGRDPCALARALEKSGVAFTAHVVGFGLGGGEDTASLACIAEETGGEYLQASNAAELGSALSAVSTAVAKAPEPEPEPEPEPALPQVTVDGPGTAVGGSEISVTWAPTVDEGDYITAVPLGAEAGEFGPYIRIGKADNVTLQVPGDEGLYEIRYVHNASKETLGQDGLEVIDPQVTLSGPDQVQTGAEFTVGWTPTINKRDYVTIVPEGSDAGTFGAYAAVSRNTETRLDAPADPGLYELRYVLNIDKRTVTSRRIEVTAPQVTLQAPDTALTGAKFKISWAGTVNRQDYVTIVPVGTDEGQYGNYLVVRDDSEGRLVAPADTGMYEVRYVLREGNRTLAREIIEITEPEVTVSGPESTATGSRFKVSWTGTVDGNDYVTIVPAGTEEGQYGNYIVVRSNDSGDMNAPADPGMYELRYVLREGNKTLATAMIEITEPQVTVTAPATALAGSSFPVTWTNPVNGNDYVTIVPVGTEEGQYGNYVVVRQETAKDLKAPAETGMYEIRYVLREGARTLATAMIEITAPEVTITAPDTALTGARIRVGWTGAVDPGDYITIVPMGTDEGKYGNYFAVRDKLENDLKAPAETGLYEIRYVLREGARTLTRHAIEITEPEVTVSGPQEVRAGDKFRASWTGAVDTSDYVTLVPMGSADDAFGEYFTVRDMTERDMTAPEETGLYELRYILREGGRVLARHPVEVLAEGAPLDTGASLSAPDTAAPGSTIDVGWSVDSDSADQRITLARGNQAIFTWITAVKITGAPPLQITLPDEPGIYELRFLDVAAQAVLSRKVIKVE